MTQGNGPFVLFLVLSNFLTLLGKIVRFCNFFLVSAVTAITFAAKINSSPYVQSLS